MGIRSRLRRKPQADTPEMIDRLQHELERHRRELYSIVFDEERAYGIWPEPHPDDELESHTDKRKL